MDQNATYHGRKKATCTKVPEGHCQGECSEEKEKRYKEHVWNGLRNSTVETTQSGEIPTTAQTFRIADAVLTHFDASVERDAVLSESGRPVGAEKIQFKTIYGEKVVASPP
jgi:hypothetical protein